MNRLSEMTKGSAERVRGLASTISAVIPTEQIATVVRNELEKRLRSLGLASTEELERLRRRVAALEGNSGARRPTKRKATAKRKGPAKSTRAAAKKKKAPARRKRR